MPDESRTPPEAQPAADGLPPPASPGPPPPSHQQQRPPWPAWYFALTAALTAARAPVITAIAYLVMVGLPDQSAEAARIMLGGHWPWALGAALVWFVLSLYLALSLAGLAERALGVHRRPDGMRNASLLQRTVILLVFSAPFLAGFLSLGPLDLLRGETQLWDHRRGWVIYVPLALFGFFAVAVLSPLLVALAATFLACCRHALARLFGTAGRRAPRPPRAWALSDDAWQLVGAWSERMVYAAGALFVLWFLVWGGLDLVFEMDVEIPALLFLPLWATALCAGLLLLVRMSARRRVPVLVFGLVLALVWAVTDLADNHEVRHHRLPAAAAAAAAPMPVDEAFARWLDARRAERAAWSDAGKDFPVLLVAAEGGGARAAYFTALVLEELRARCPRLLRHTFLIAGVSGGSVGASLVAASAAAPALRPSRLAPPPAELCEAPGAGGSSALKSVGANADAALALHADLLSPLVRGLLLPDLLARLLPVDLGRMLPEGALRRGWDDAVRRPVSNVTDRSRYLERALDRAWRNRTGRSIEELPFRAAWPGPEADVPALMLLTTDVTTGRRVAVSHLAMPPPPAPAAPPGERPAAPPAPPAAAPGLATAAPDPGCAPRLTADAPPTALARLRSLAEEAPGVELPLATAAVLSARFTLVTPAGTLPCPGPRRRLVDGGYFENSGLTTVLEVVDALRPVARDRRAALMILRIENSRATTNAGNAYGAAPQDPPGWLAEIASPLRALMATREARGEQARAAVTRAVEQSLTDCRAARRAAVAADQARGVELTPCVEIGEFAFTLSPGCVPVPLGWSLSDAARQEMQEQLLGLPAAKGCAEEGTDGRARNRRAMGSLFRLLTPPAPP